MLRRWMDHGWHQAHIDAIDFAENIKADRDAQQTELARQEFDVQVLPFIFFNCSYSNTEFDVQVPPFYSATAPTLTLSSAFRYLPFILLLLLL
jgi:hypothetical protein